MSTMSQRQWDYKWRKRMCYKWQEEMRQEQLKAAIKVQSSPSPTSAPIPSAELRPHQPSIAGSNFGAFMADPKNLRKLFLSRSLLQLLAPRLDIKRLARGCFVRVNLERGFGPAQHRVAQIMGFGSRGGWPADLLLSLRIDRDQPHIHTLEQLANCFYEPAELLQWQHIAHISNFEFPPRRLVDQKYKLITDAKQQQLQFQKEGRIGQRTFARIRGGSKDSPMTQSARQLLDTIRRIDARMSGKLVISTSLEMETLPHRQLPPRKRSIKPTAVEYYKLPALEPPPVELERPLDLTMKKKISLDEYRRRRAQAENFTVHI